jgi:hypothetical protein
MTSVIGCKIYSTRCCQTPIKIAIYASLSREPAHSNYKCSCGKNPAVTEMEFVGMEKNDGGQIPSGGFDDFKIPDFLRKKS